MNNPMPDPTTTINPNMLLSISVSPAQVPDRTTTSAAQCICAYAVHFVRPEIVAEKFTMLFL
jgi:hypothetical protein